MSYPSRQHAFDLLNRYTSKPGLIKHAIAVEEVMRYFARQCQGDEEEWGIAGLIRDLDYEMFPDQHCLKAKEILEADGWPKNLIRAVLAHGWGLFTEVKPESEMEKHLYATDELSGFIVACALVRPTKKLSDVDVEFVCKKWRIPSFAAGVKRAVVARGAELLNTSFERLANETLKALQASADKLGL
jgi:predicted hydrolase (HD superfamily)